MESQLKNSTPKDSKIENFVKDKTQTDSYEREMEDRCAFPLLVVKDSFTGSHWLSLGKRIMGKQGRF